MASVPAKEETCSTMVIRHGMFSKCMRFHFYKANMLITGAAQCAILTTSLISTFLLSKIFLKEHIGFTKITAAILSIGGTMAILRPDIFQGNIDGAIYYLFTLIAGFSTGLGVTIKQGTVINQLNTVQWLLWNQGLSVICFLIAVFASKPTVIDFSAKDALFLALFIIGAISSRTLHTYSLQFTSGVVAVVSYSSSVVFMLSFQYTVLKEYHPGHKDWLEVIGAFCVIIASILTPVVQQAKRCTKNESQKNTNM